MFDFGMRIQQLRMDRKMSQETLGKKLGRSKSVICGYENNLRVPPLDILVQIAVIFNVSLDYLVGIDKNEMVSIDGLTDGQKKTILDLIAVFKVKEGAVTDIVNSLRVFAEKNADNKHFTDKEKKKIKNTVIEYTGNYVVYITYSNPVKMKKAIWKVIQ